MREAAAKGDKGAKKFMKLKLKHETAYEQNIKEEEERIAEIEQMKSGVELNNETAMPSLFHVVNYISNYFVRFLPTAKCLGC